MILSQTIPRCINKDFSPFQQFNLKANQDTLLATEESNPTIVTANLTQHEKYKSLFNMQMLS
jgi:hypothetical protein